MVGMLLLSVAGIIDTLVVRRFVPTLLGCVHPTSTLLGDSLAGV